MAIDLHVHSTASDGTRSPEAVVEFAHACGVTTLALADHDTLDGIRPASKRAAALGIEYIPAIELNTDVPGKGEIHILGYYIDLENDAFCTMLADRQAARVRRARGMIDRLRQVGVDLDYDEIRAAARGVVARPHIARAMIDKGYVPDMQTALKQYLRTGGPAYVPRDEIAAVDAIRLILAAGGVPVLAHPGLYKGEEALDSFIAAGLRGIEVYYRAHTAEQVAQYAALARQHGLLMTGGTDCHGPGTHRDFRIGDVAIPFDILPPLREAGRR
ncbi:MAG TPA: PHP domain-containing protein [Symbiobacteriaceae bacterium]|nr:PHP domain-containing protein [Symbiobacteriaceae bacterium]